MRARSTSILRFLSSDRRPWALLAALILACTPTLRAPEVQPKGAFDTSAKATKKPAPEKFAVVFAGPEGEVGAEPQVSVVMNRPLRPLGDAEQAPAPPVVITPKIPGKFRWIGQSAFVFVPEGNSLPLSTRFEVKVPAGTKALSGEVLTDDYTFGFTTERPRIVSTSPSEGTTGLREDATFELFLNQPIAVGILKKYVDLSRVAGGKHTKLRYSLDLPDPASPKRVRLRPLDTLTRGHEIKLTVDGNLPGSEGPLTAGETRVFSFETFGPLEVRDLECASGETSGTCYPHGGVWVQTSTPIRLGELKAHVSIDPPSKLAWESYRTDDDETMYSDIPVRLEPGRAYKVTIKAGVRDVFGQKLERDYTRTFRVDDYTPSVALGLSGEHFEATRAPEIPFASVNVDRFTVLGKPLTEAGVEAYFARSNQSSEASEALVRGAKELEIRPKASRNSPGGEVVSIESLAGRASYKGPLAIGLRYRRGTERLLDTRVIQITNLAISAKLSRGDRSIVSVTNLSTGAPVEGASVFVRGRDLNAPPVLTGKDGIATLPAGALGEDPELHDQEIILFARKGDDLVFRMAHQYVYPWRLDVPADPYGRPRTNGLLFTERGIYRPGDAVELKGIVRQEAESANVIPTDEPFELTVIGPTYDEVEKVTVRSSSFGSFSHRLSLPKTAPLGSYRVQLGHPKRGFVSAAYFEVAEYRPAEIQVRAEADRPGFLQGDRAKYSVFGDYLYGAKMAGASLTYRVTRLETYHSIPGHTDLVFDASLYESEHPEASPSGGTLKQGDAKLDKEGRFDLTVPLDLPGQRGPEMVSLDVEVSDATNQTVATSTSAVVHPSSYYVGLAPLDPYFVASGEKVTPKSLVVSPEGRVVTEKKVKYELYERKWVVARATSGDAYSEVQTVDALVESCTATSGAKASGCSLTVPRAGYFLVVAEVRDEKGRRHRSSVDLYATGSGESWWRDRDDFKVQVTPDKKQYKVGDVAKIIVQSPFKKTRALITVEGDGVRESRVTTLTGAAPVLEFPITEAMRPNAYVGVHLLKERTEPSAKQKNVDADVHAPSYRIGYAALRVDPEERRLAVELTPNRTDFLPGAPIDVSLRVKNSAGRPEMAEVTVYAVDEGVLSLIGYRTPDPLGTFTAARPLRTATLETRDDLGKVDRNFAQLLGLGADKGYAGGGGGEESSGARRDFRQSAYFNPAVLTNERGEAKVSFRLPESLTTYRLMAVATTKSDRYGYAENRVTTSRRLMARPALPRHLRVGDAFEAKLVVSAKHFGPAKVSVNLAATGLVTDGETRKEVEIPRDGQAEVGFPLRAEAPGEAKLTFSVATLTGGGKETDRVEVTRPIALPMSLESTALYGETDTRSAEALGNLSALRPDVGGLSVSVSSTALVGLDAGLSSLLDYPYGCSEQITSKLLPLLSLRDLEKRLALTLPKNVDAFIEKGLADVLSRQRGDGGFGMWPESTQSSQWVSPYVLWMLSEANKRGFPVPKSALTLGAEYLRRLLDAPPARLDGASGAFALDVLAELGSADPGYENRILERKDELPSFAKALLLHAMAKRGAEPERLTALARELENGLVLEDNRAVFVGNAGSAYAKLMDSDTRTTALILRALVETDATHPLLSKLARGLLAARDRGNYRTTQETSFALLALADFQRKVEGKGEALAYRVWGGDSILHQGRVDLGAGSDKFDVAMKDLAFEKLVFEKSAGNRLYYEARLRYAKRELPTTPLDEGFTVEKRMRALSPLELGGTLPLREDDVREVDVKGLVLVDLLVVSPTPKNFVVVDDPLPAGLEAVDARLRTTSARYDVEGNASNEFPSDDDIAHGRSVLTSYERKELRDDRATFFIDSMSPGIYHFRYLARATTRGRFVIGPTKAEEMYAPEVFGRTAARTFTVR